MGPASALNRLPSGRTVTSPASCSPAGAGPPPADSFTRDPRGRPRRATRPTGAVGGGLNQAPLLDDVVDGHHVGLTRVHSELGEDGHQGLAEGVKVLLRVPDVVDHEVVVGTERGMVRAALRLTLSRGFELLHDLVVLGC